MNSDRRSPRVAGTGALVRLALRRDRVKLPAWIAGLGLFVIYVGAAFPQVAPTEEDLAGLVPLFNQPVGRMFTGPAFGMDAPTYERFFAAGYAPYLAVLAAVMNVLLITRHTRAEEESGRAEMVRANVTGRHAPLTAALVVAAIANVVAAVVVAGMALAQGFAVMGSVLVGVNTGLTGMAFAGITAVTAQLSAYSRSAAGLAGIVLGTAFVVRALGDMAAVGGSALSWVSPLGWSAQTAPYVHDRWAPLGLLLALATVAVAAAYALQGRRDFGAGLIATRPGAATAHPWLGRPFGLAARLQRGAFFGWGGAILALGAVDGAFTQAMLDAGDDMPAAMHDMFGTQGLLDGWIAFLGWFAAVVTAAYAVFALHTARTEEGHGRADLVLATPVSRAAWLGSHVLVVALGATVILLAAGVGTGLAAGVVTGDWALVGPVVAAHLNAGPAVLLVLGVCAALFGWAPRLMSVAGWALVALIAVVAFFGDLLNLPGWLRLLSPLEYLPRYPLESFAFSPFAVLCGVAVMLGALGLLGFRRREVQTG